MCKPLIGTSSLLFVYGYVMTCIFLPILKSECIYQGACAWSHVPIGLPILRVMGYRSS